MDFQPLLKASVKDPNLGYVPHGYWRYKSLWHYQWAWQFARRNPAYIVFYPECEKVYDEIATGIENLEKMDDPFLAIWIEFSKTKAYQKLNEFGLIVPENPKKHGRRIRADIWAPEHFLNTIVVRPNEPVYAPGHTILLSCDMRRPFEFLMAEAAEILKQAGCREHVTHIYPEQFEELLRVYDQYATLHRNLERRPTNYEVAKALHPCEWDEFISEYGHEENSALNNEFAARYAHKIKKAKDYVEGRQYLDLMRWRPYEGHFKT